MPPELYASTGHASAKKRNKIPRAANLGEDADAHRSFGDGDAMRVSVTWEKVDARAHGPVGADPLDSDTFVPADARADRPLDDDAAENAPRAPATVPDAFDDDAFATHPGIPTTTPSSNTTPNTTPGIPNTTPGIPNTTPGIPTTTPRPNSTPGIIPRAHSSPHDLDDVPVNVAPHGCAVDQMLLLEERLAAGGRLPAPCGLARRRPTPTERRPNIPEEGRAFATRGPPRRTANPPSRPRRPRRPLAWTPTSARGTEERAVVRVGIVSSRAGFENRGDARSRRVVRRVVPRISIRGRSFRIRRRGDHRGGERSARKKAATSTSASRPARQAGREEEEAMESGVRGTRTRTRRGRRRG